MLSTSGPAVAPNSARPEMARGVMRARGSVVLLVADILVPQVRTVTNLEEVWRQPGLAGTSEPRPVVAQRPTAPAWARRQINGAAEYDDVLRPGC